MSKWNRAAASPSSAVATPSLHEAATSSSPAVYTVSKQDVAKLEAYVKGEVKSNNLLNIDDDQINGLVTNLTTCTTKKEVFDWCSTFMLSESVAAEIIKRRDDRGPYFEGFGPKAPVTQTTGGRQVSLGQQKAKRGARKSAAEVSGARPLVEGKLFECGCCASFHPFRGNCVNCGRIFCMQESFEACYHCGVDPSRCIEYEIKVQCGLVDQAAEQKNAIGYNQAVEKRDQLLKYARERTKRTVVIDDQSGMFMDSKNAWLSSTERAEVEDAEAAARRKQITTLHQRTGAYTVHLDIVNQNVALGARVEDVQSNASLSTVSLKATETLDGDDDECNFVDDDTQDAVCDYLPEESERVVSNPKLLQKFWYVEEGKEPKSQKVDATTTDGTKKPQATRIIRESVRLQNEYYEEDAMHWAEERIAALVESANHATIPFAVPTTAAPLVTADDATPEPTASTDLVRHFEEMNGAGTVTKVMRSIDEGMCLSMHQPYASLLVAGIKTHEGRTWSTPHRGRLWIHAAAAKPTNICAVAAHYEQFCPTVKLPEQYPTGSLLGYVYVTDCIDQDEYEERIPPEQRQETSPFTLLCAEAKALPFPLPMEGKHKIFKLDRKIWLAAKQQLNEKK